MSESPASLSSNERHSYLLGRRSFERGDDATALTEFRRLLETRQGFADVHYMMGVSLERQDEVRAAARSFVQALRINPDYAEARLGLASLYEREGDFQRSREITEQASARAVPRAGTHDPTTRGKLANPQADLGDAFCEPGAPGEGIGS